MALPTSGATDIHEPPLTLMADADLVSLAERLQGLCLGRGLTVSVAESCTGGLVATTLTAVPGSSGYFLGAVVSYADGSKVRLLAVPGSTIEAHGTVSAQTARAMAQGVRDRFGSSLAASVTGVAGPDGGSLEKPVGLTYVGLADADFADVRRFTWGGDREGNRNDSARAVLAWLIERAQDDTQGSVR
ncbi:MAG: CinA family protein [Chloroflexota bacterium]